MKDRSGQEHCYNCIIETYQTRAYNLAHHILGDWAMAEDATQEALLSGYRAFRSFRGENLRSWLLRIVANACRDMLRARKARPVLSIDAPPPDLEASDISPFDPPSPDESPEEYALRRELGREIEAGLQALPEKHRTAVSLVDVQGFSYKEAAEVMSCTLGTVKSRLARGRGELRDFLQSHADLLPSQFRHDR